MQQRETEGGARLFFTQERRPCLFPATEAPLARRMPKIKDLNPCRPILGVRLRGRSPRFQASTRPEKRVDHRRDVGSTPGARDGDVLSDQGQEPQSPHQDEIKSGPKARLSTAPKFRILCCATPPSAADCQCGTPACLFNLPGRERFGRFPISMPLRGGAGPRRKNPPSFVLARICGSMERFIGI